MPPKLRQNKLELFLPSIVSSTIVSELLFAADSKIKFMSEKPSDKMKDLVKFMIYLAILGVIIALSVYFITSAAHHAPLNTLYSIDTASTGM
jgi:hypothetical protein